MYKFICPYCREEIEVKVNFTLPSSEYGTITHNGECKVDVIKLLEEYNELSNTQ